MSTSARKQRYLALCIIDTDIRWLRSGFDHPRPPKADCDESATYRRSSRSSADQGRKALATLRDSGRALRYPGSTSVGRKRHRSHPGNLPRRGWNRNLRNMPRTPVVRDHAHDRSGGLRKPSLRFRSREGSLRLEDFFKRPVGPVFGSSLDEYPLLLYIDHPALAGWGVCPRKARLRLLRQGARYSH